MTPEPVNDRSPIYFMIGGNAAAAFFAALLMTATGRQHVSQYVLVIYIGILLAQATMLAIWSALGVERGLLRLGGSLAFIALASMTTGMVGIVLGDAAEALAFFFILMLVQWLAAQSPLWLLRLAWSFRMDRPRSTGFLENARDRQFHLGQLLLVIAVLGVLLGLGRLVHGLGFLDQFKSGALVIGLFLLANVVIGVPACWATLSPGFPAPRIVAGVAYAAAITWLSILLCPILFGRTPREVNLLLCLFNAAQFGWLLCCLLLVRLAGYRLIRGAKQDGPTSSPAEGNS